jgi:hypothetical protein
VIARIRSATCVLSFAGGRGRESFWVLGGGLARLEDAQKLRGRLQDLLKRRKGEAHRRTACAPSKAHYVPLQQCACLYSGGTSRVS